MEQTISPKLDIQHLNLHYGSFHALKDVTFEVHEGEIVSRLRQIHAAQVPEPDE